MKFGQQLNQSILPEWKFYYLDYDGLKRMIKERTAAASSTENDENGGKIFRDQDEAIFIDALEEELDKVIYM